MRPDIIAFVVAMAGIMLPAIAKTKEEQSAVSTRNRGQSLNYVNKKKKR